MRGVDMSGREETLKLLAKTHETEEKSVPIYLRHLESAIFWAGIPAAGAERAKEVLERLARDSRRHAAVVEEMIDALNRRGA